MNIKSRKARWICGILAVVFIAVGFASFKSNERKHIEYAKKLGCDVGQRWVFPDVVYLYLPQQLHSFMPKGSVWSVTSFESRATDADVEKILGYFPDLNWLDLSETRITDEILKIVLAHPKLWALELNRTSVTDEGVKELSKSQSLLQVSINRTKITDESIAHLSKMRQLQVLSVMHTPLTDKSVDMLCQMSNLISLDITGTQISEEGKQRLEKNLKTVLY